MRKLFEHQFLPNFDLPRVEIEGKRFYQLPDGSLAKSVTTAIGDSMDKTHLYEWRKRVGEEEANKISSQAAVRGTAIHSICESYLMNESSFPKGTMPSNIDSFKQLKPYMDANIGLLYGIEHRLYSTKLKAAGTADCICQWNGVPTIVDFKTSRKIKKEEWIQNYYLQATTYAMMVEELFDIEVPQFCIMITVDHEDPQIFVKKKAPYVDRVLEIFR